MSRIIHFHPRMQRGFGLIEVMVSLIIISIGLLGMAALQASALANTHGSQLESMMAIEARRLADSMLANPAYWNALGTVATSITVTPATSGAASTTPTITASGGAAFNATANCAGGSNCSAIDMASYDVAQWAQQFFSAVPNATGATISCYTNLQPYYCKITLSWAQKKQTAINSGTSNSTATATTLQTYTLVNQF